MRTALTAAVVLLAATGMASAASDWKVLGWADGGAAVHLDAESVRIKEGQRSAWVKIQERARPGRASKETLQFQVVKCAAEIMAVPEGVVRVGGKVRDSWHDAYPVFKRVVPDSVGERIFKELCEEYELAD